MILLYKKKNYNN